MFTQEQLELTLIKAATTSLDAMQQIEKQRIDPKEYFSYQYEGHTRPYLQAIFKAACDYYKTSGGLLTENALGYLLKTKYKKGVKDEDVRHIMSLWKQIQIHPYDQNDLYILFQQARDSASLRDYLLIPQKTTAWLQEDGLEAACENTVEVCQKILKRIRGGDENVERLEMETASSYFKNEYTKRRDQPELYEGIKFGYNELDKVTFGIQGGQIFTIIASQSSGKSVLMMNIGHNMRYKYKKKVAYISYEMKQWLMCCRHLALHYEIPFYKFKGIKLEQEELDMLIADMARPDESGAWFEYCINTDDRSPDFIESELRRMKNTKGLPDVLIIDYLGAMKMNGNTTSKRWEHQEAALERIFEISMNWNLPIILAQQLKGSVFTENRKLAAAGKQVQYQQDAAFGATALIDYSYYVVALQPNKDEGEAIIHPIKIRDTWFTPFCIKWDSLINKCIDLNDEEQRTWRINHGFTVVKNDGSGQNIIDTQDNVIENDDGDLIVQRGSMTDVVKQADLSLDGFEWNPD